MKNEFFEENEQDEIVGDGRNFYKPRVKIGYDVMFNPLDQPQFYPICPSCGEPPYSYTRCVFCGQHFIKEN